MARPGRFTPPGKETGYPSRRRHFSRLLPEADRMQHGVTAVQLYKKSLAFYAARKLYCNHKRPPIATVLDQMNTVQPHTAFLDDPY